MTKIWVKLIVLSALILVGYMKSVSAEDVDRGKLLYENHCGVCHTPAIHQRENRKSKTLVDISKWVIRWQHHLKLGWSFEEVSAVTRYLNATYYNIESSPSSK